MPAHRPYLRSHLVQAWRATLNVEYCGQLINSERGLQGYFCQHLMQLLNQEQELRQRRIFIEPRLSTPDAQGRKYPDILICDAEKIIGIVEFKYKPKMRPDYAKDLDTLKFADEHHRSLYVSNDRFLGISFDDKRYALAQNAVLCSAGVYAGRRLELVEKLPSQMKRRFLQLDAITKNNQNPRLLCNDKEIP